MTISGFLRLAAQTLTAPQEVARLLLALNLPREVLLTGFALVVVLNALLVGGMQAMGGTAGAMPLGFGPGVMAALLAMMLAATIFFMTWAGRVVGGTGRMQDVAVLLIWLQALRALAQLGVALVAGLSGALAAILVMAALVAGLWIVVNFLDVAHGLNSPLKAILVLVLATVGLMLALTLLLPLLGITPDRMAGYV
mgnify:FL=1